MNYGSVNRSNLSFGHTLHFDITKPCYLFMVYQYLLFKCRNTIQRVLAHKQYSCIEQRTLHKKNIQKKFFNAWEEYEPVTHFNNIQGIVMCKVHWRCFGKAFKSPVYWRQPGSDSTRRRHPTGTSTGNPIVKTRWFYDNLQNGTPQQRIGISISKQDPGSYLFKYQSLSIGINHTFDMFDIVGYKRWVNVFSDIWVHIPESTEHDR